MSPNCDDPCFQLGERNVHSLLMPSHALQSVVHSLASRQLADAQAAEAAAAALARKAIADVQPPVLRSCFRALSPPLSLAMPGQALARPPHSPTVL